MRALNLYTKQNQLDISLSTNKTDDMVETIHN